jgi:hypothetical protein
VPEKSTLNITIEPSLDKIKQFLTDALLADLEKLHPDEVVVIRGVRKSWKKRYKDTDLVKIVTANDGRVCKHCQDMVAHNPYSYGDAKKQLPHHPGCRCQIRSLRATDPAYLAQPTFEKFSKYMLYSVRNAVRARRAIKQKGKKVPQRGASITKLRKKGKRFVAPSGYRAIKVYKRQKGKG